ncbi:hypothetical protein JYT86_00675, partial [bacterium AH-315-N03]|nr:hypothetical protein [bacterium AH-315-N03]
MAATLGYRHGWKSKVARRLGVHPSFVSKIHDDKVNNVGVEIVERAMSLMGVPRSYFFEEGGREGVGRILDFAPPDEKGFPKLEFMDETTARQDAREAARSKHWARAEEVAQRVFHAAASGSVPEILASELVESVMASDLLRAVQKVQRASGARSRRNAALELAVMVDG